MVAASHGKGDLPARAADKSKTRAQKTRAAKQFEPLAQYSWCRVRRSCGYLVTWLSPRFYSVPCGVIIKSARNRDAL